MTLTPEQLQAIGEARQRGRKITRATSVATISGWSMAVFAFMTLFIWLISGDFSLVALLLGIGLAVVAYVELRGAKRLRQLDDTAPRLLGFNQIGLGVMVSLYCCWGMWQAVAGPSPYDAYLAQSGATAEMMGQIDHLNRAITGAVYAALLCMSVIAQGCTALYYFSRRRHMVRYLSETPDWVVETLRIAA